MKLKNLLCLQKLVIGDFSKLFLGAAEGFRLYLMACTKFCI